MGKAPRTVARLLNESRIRNAALSLLGEDDPVIAPDLVVAEVSNAAWKLARAGEISEKHGTRIAEAVASCFSCLFAASRLSGRAYSLASLLDHSVYDCLYLALAELEGTHLLTSDRRLANKVAGTTSAGLVRTLSLEPV